jgi:ferredoxin
MILHVIFELAGREIPVAAGARFLDALDEIEVHELPVACRGANCAACLVRVIEGSEALQPPMAAEQNLLTARNAARSERLGCQLWVHPNPSANRVKLERGPSGSAL